jgi:hypothetical protein
MRGLDPRIHLFRKKMDRRVKPGDDDGRINMNETGSSAVTAPSPSASPRR